MPFRRATSPPLPPLAKGGREWDSQFTGQFRERVPVGAFEGDAGFESLGAHVVTAVAGELDAVDAGFAGRVADGGDEFVGFCEKVRPARALRGIPEDEQDVLAFDRPFCRGGTKAAGETRDEDVEDQAESERFVTLIAAEGEQRARRAG